MKIIHFPTLKRRNNLLLLVSFLVFTHSFGQITEGHFQYAIKVTALDTSLATKQKAGMMYNSSMNLYFTQSNSRIDFTIGTIFATSIIVDTKNKNGLSLSSNPKGQFAVPLFPKDIEAAQPAEDSSLRVVLLDEKTVILGFNCKKAILTQSGNSTIYWYTDEINVAHVGNTIMNKNIPGFPLYFSTIAEGMKMEYQASNYSFELENEEVLFSLAVPEGYKFINTGGH